MKYKRASPSWSTILGWRIKYSDVPKRKEAIVGIVECRFEGSPCAETWPSLDRTVRLDGLGWIRTHQGPERCP